MQTYKKTDLLMRLKMSKIGKSKPHSLSLRASKIIYFIINDKGS
jgi:hypothetical protein